jgi:hypothetical protein
VVGRLPKLWEALLNNPAANSRRNRIPLGDPDQSQLVRCQTLGAISNPCSQTNAPGLRGRLFLQTDGNPLAGISREWDPAHPLFFTHTKTFIRIHLALEGRRGVRPCQAADSPPLCDWDRSTVLPPMWRLHAGPAADRPHGQDELIFKKV